MKTVLTIAGSDSIGGAGIQADIKTITMNNVYAMSVVTALTAQNTMGVKAIQESTPEFLEKQIDTVFEDIYPDAIKIGMVPSSKLICVIADKLKYYNAKNIVIDPVMISTSGACLVKNQVIKTLVNKLFPLGVVITPNIPEAEVLCEYKIKNEEDMLIAVKKISNLYNCAVLLKGGHNINNANDLLFLDDNIIWFKEKRIENTNTHGTGCTLSSAIASNLAKGFDLIESIKLAKKYISGALNFMLNIGKGSGPINHMFYLNKNIIFAKEKN